MIETNDDDDFCTSERPSTKEKFTAVSPVEESGWVYAHKDVERIVICAETSSSDTCEVPLTKEEAREFATWLLKAAGE